ncbi:hypothetical protein LMG28727_00612 [Paraburkholderia kirstenboschensis]|nr:hypothetical protein LMG28727_00612 [Paraburkholderia kirstenboschensis]
MTPRGNYRQYWYEISVTSVGPTGSPWQGELRLGREGSEEPIVDSLLVPGYFDTEPQAREAADAYARVYVDQL